MFPARSAAEVHAATAERWDLSRSFPVPRPGWLACPVCGTSDPLPRWWQFHRHGNTIPWRCDVSIKCISCAAVWVHGVALTEEAWRARPTTKDVSKRYTRREVETQVGGE